MREPSASWCLRSRYWSDSLKTVLRLHECSGPAILPPRRLLRRSQTRMRALQGRLLLPWRMMAVVVRRRMICERQTQRYGLNRGVRGRGPLCALPRWQRRGALQSQRGGKAGRGGPEHAVRGLVGDPPCRVRRWMPSRGRCSPSFSSSLPSFVRSPRGKVECDARMRRTTAVLLPYH